MSCCAAGAKRAWLFPIKPRGYDDIRKSKSMDFEVSIWLRSVQRSPGPTKRACTPSTALTCAEFVTLPTHSIRAKSEGNSRWGPDRTLSGTERDMSLVSRGGVAVGGRGGRHPLWISHEPILCPRTVEFGMRERTVGGSITYSPDSIETVPGASVCGLAGMGVASLLIGRRLRRKNSFLSD